VEAEVAVVAVVDREVIEVAVAWQVRLEGVASDLALEVYAYHLDDLAKLEVGSERR
jgi:hypothetical protein